MFGYQTRYVWLYSANYSDAWWLYDATATRKLNKIQKDFSIRKTLLEDHDDPPGPLSPPRPSRPPLTETSCEPVEFAEADAEGEADEVDAGADAEEQTTSSDPYLTYLLEVAGNHYYIDLERMKQINCSDVTKQRRIRKVEVPSKIQERGIVRYLREELGITVKTR